MRRIFFLLLKAVASIALLYLALRSVNLTAVGERLSHIGLAWLTVSWVIISLQVMVGALRWREIINACAAKLSFLSALQISFVGVFFSQVLPSTVGGDAARIWLLGRKEGRWAAAAYSVLIDRVVGVTVLAAIVLACLPWTLTLTHDPLARTVLILIGFGALIGATIFLALGIWPLPLFERFAPTRHLVASSRAAWQVVRSPRSILIVSISSLVIHSMTVTATWACAKAVGAPVSFAHILFLMPPVLLIATVPISIAGWGVRESSMVLAFAQAGLAPSDGLILSILFGLVSFAVGIIGGIIWVGTIRAPSTERTTATDGASYQPTLR